jgi:hypothetical protein
MSTNEQRGFVVEIIERKTRKVVESMPARTFEEAERIERGAQRNLNRRDYRTTVRRGDA